MARIAIITGAGLAALVWGIGVGWTAHQWQPMSTSVDQDALVPVESVVS